MTADHPPARPSFALGIDVGGTFTDVVLAGPRGQEAVAKILTTPDDPAEAVMAGIDAVLGALGPARGDQANGAALGAAETCAETCAETRGTAARGDPVGGADGTAETRGYDGYDGPRIDRVVHATTLATNLVLERRGERVAFVTTEGFGDLLTLGRYARVEEDRYDLLFDPPAPPVAPEDCFEVTERIDADGTVAVPLNEQKTRETAQTINANAIAICLLHSYANPAHERRVAEILKEENPDATVVASSDVWPELREYERATTTLVSAYVAPVMATYLADLSGRLRAKGIDATLQVMESSGGVMSAATAARHAVATIESGPAAGAMAARRVGRQTGRKDLISFDMGGTTAKACVIRDGEPAVTREFHVGGKGSFGGRRAGTGIPIKIPAIDLAEVGAGGGSVAWVDGGTLRVGPRSAGARPGPACYGRGGDRPTVTDANLILGYLDPDSFEAFPLHPELAVKAMTEWVAGPLGVSVTGAAAAVHEIANALMGSAVHVVTVQRGIDPRGFALVAMGGAGPVHGARLAERFGIETVIVPPSCGVGSAVGLLATDLSTDRARTLAKGAPIEPAFAELVAAAMADLGPDGRASRAADVRYRGQGHDLTVPVPDGPFDAERLDRDFREQYRRAFGIASEDPTEVVAVRVRVTCPVPAVPLGDRRRRPGDTYVGPVNVRDGESTIVVPPGWTARVDPHHNVVLERA